MNVTGRSQRGQASVELALVLPLVLMVLLVVVQVGLLARDRLVVVHATRAAARAVIVEPSTAAATTALRRQGVHDSATVHVAGQLHAGGLATVVVQMPPTRLPLVGRALAGVTLRESLTVHVEGRR